MRRYIIKSNHLTDVEKDNVKEQVVAHIQRNKNVALKINRVDNETDYTLKQLNNDCMKTSATENEYNKLER